MISVDDLVIRYAKVDVVAGVQLDAAPGTTLGLVGPNGSGKTSILRAMLGAIKVRGGQVFINDRTVAQMRTREVARELAVVSQSDESEAGTLTVRDYVLLGRSVHVPAWASWRDADHEAAESAMQAVGVEQFASRRITSLSGGERQRAAIARALSQGSTHLLLDEPTNHLDVRYQHEILRIVSGLDLCTVVVLHDLNQASRYCDNIVLLDHGEVAAHGTPPEVFDPITLEAVYGIPMRRIDDNGVVQLLMGSADRARVAVHPSLSHN